MNGVYRASEIFLHKIESNWPGALPCWYGPVSTSTRACICLLGHKYVVMLPMKLREVSNSLEYAMGYELFSYLGVFWII